eukprot:6186507-Pleurochrysis_carterae.AAC.3
MVVFEHGRSRFRRPSWTKWYCSLLDDRCRGSMAYIVWCFALVSPSLHCTIERGRTSYAQANNARVQELEKQIALERQRDGDLQAQWSILELQYAGSQKEQRVCEEELRVLRARCDEYAAQLQAKRGEIESQRRI